MQDFKMKIFSFKNVSKVLLYSSSSNINISNIHSYQCHTSELSGRKMGELQCTLEFSTELHKFINVDLFQRG
ncbi:UNVERIFIED_CONTAM: hypothetical protein NCL1_28073 [Trichonephila clavipes]